MVTWWITTVNIADCGRMGFNLSTASLYLSNNTWWMKIICRAILWNQLKCYVYSRMTAGVWFTWRVAQLKSSVSVIRMMGRSSADGLPVAWLLRPSGPLSSDCHSWCLWCRFLQRSHSLVPKPPTKHRLPRLNLSWCYLSWQMERQRLEINLYLPPLICLFSCVPWLIHQSLAASLHHSIPPLSFPFLVFLFISSTFLFPHLLPQKTFSNPFRPFPQCSHSFIWIASTLEGIIH